MQSWRAKKGWGLEFYVGQHIVIDLTPRKSPVGSFAAAQVVAVEDQAVIVTLCHDDEGYPEIFPNLRDARHAAWVGNFKCEGEELRITRRALITKDLGEWD